MAKWYGNIGYANMVEIAPGDWTEKIVTRPYYGDSIRNTRLLQQNSESTNNNVNIGNQLSIVADPYANDHIYDMRYAEFQGNKWTISNVDVQFPRLILTLGGLYNDGN